MLGGDLSTLPVSRSCDESSFFMRGPSVRSLKSALLEPTWKDSGEHHSAPSGERCCAGPALSQTAGSTPCLLLTSRHGAPAQKARKPA